MKRIISVSRRTDIPAFYGDWFMGRVRDGFAGVVNPFGGRRYVVSLRPQDVVCFVFWSKNFTPFMENLRILNELGYKFYFNYTVTGLPDVFESAVEKQSAIEGLKQLSKMYSPGHINWRFDPIILSDLCGREFFLRAFEDLACEFEGLVERCIFSFVTEYGKVKRNFAQFEKTSGVKIIRHNKNFKIELANELAAIAALHGMKMSSCCCDYLINDRIAQAHCVDGNVIEQLFFLDGLKHKEKPTRPHCGCTESSDIGTYDTCPHGCIYCYANVNKDKATESHRNHDKDSAFLGYSKSDSDRWLAEIQAAGIQEMLW